MEEKSGDFAVAPGEGAWIEIPEGGRAELAFKSLPVRERGLKYFVTNEYKQNYIVAPGEGAWIEISNFINVCLAVWVAPGEGAWIEMILNFQTWPAPLPSLPVRERGLKYFIQIVFSGSI